MACVNFEKTQSLAHFPTGAALRCFIEAGSFKSFKPPELITVIRSSKFHCFLWWLNHLRKMVPDLVFVVIVVNLGIYYVVFKLEGIGGVVYDFYLVSQ